MSQRYHLPRRLGELTPVVRRPEANNRNRSHERRQIAKHLGELARVLDVHHEDVRRERDEAVARGEQACVYSARSAGSFRENGDGYDRART